MLLRPELLQKTLQQQTLKSIRVRHHCNLSLGPSSRERSVDSTLAANRFFTLVKSLVSGVFAIPARMGSKSTYANQPAIAVSSSRICARNRPSQNLPETCSSLFPHRDGNGDGNGDGGNGAIHLCQPWKKQKAHISRHRAAFP
jgi:hypothetical protein